MQYALLIYSKPGAAEALSADEREANHREYMDIKKLPGVVGGASLHPVETATTVRVQDGQTLVTDGPFADTKEIFAGFYLIEADDLDQATELAVRIPAARIGGSVGLAIASGVNFPDLVYAWATGEPLHEVTRYRTGRRLRWLGGDVWNLKCVFDSQGRPDIPPRGRAVATFMSDFLLRPRALDFVEVGDMMPAVVEMRETVFRHAIGRVRRLAPGKRLAREGKVK